MNDAQRRLFNLFVWAEASSVSRRDPVGDNVHVFGKFATPVVVDFSEPPTTDFHVEALPIFIDRAFAAGVDLPAPDLGDVPSQHGAAQRAAQIVWRVQDHTLPPCAIFALTNPLTPISAAIEAAGGVGVDTSLFPVIAFPVWHMPDAGRRDLLASLPWRPKRNVDPDPDELPKQAMVDRYAWARDFRAVWPT